ncbi:ABC transporter lipid export ABCA family [Anopheles sinensis]|uniref:ABC transporter lipid export ABCA family n=1 Tax=Anopheles sinensis TaxID=74873 RepID=A0A084WGV0_ANOSI|nr:ABC transporter lipid export ABCA family [Anopheles sinensis]
MGNEELDDAMVNNLLGIMCMRLCFLHKLATPYRENCILGGFWQFSPLPNGASGRFGVVLSILQNEATKANISSANTPGEEMHHRSSVRKTDITIGEVGSIPAVWPQTDN